MTIFLGDYTAEFARPKGAKDKKPRLRRRYAIATAAGLAGGGAIAYGLYKTRGLGKSAMNMDAVKNADSYKPKNVPSPDDMASGMVERLKKDYPPGFIRNSSTSRSSSSKSTAPKALLGPKEIPMEMASPPPSATGYKGMSKAERKAVIRRRRQLMQRSSSLPSRPRKGGTYDLRQKPNLTTGQVYGGGRRQRAITAKALARDARRKYGANYSMHPASSSLMLGDYTAEFRRGPDKRPRKRRIGQDASRVGSTAIAGASLGTLAPVLVPRKVGFINKALASKGMKRIPGIGKGLQAQGSQARNLPLNQNAAAVTAGALGAGALGAAYGLNQVRRDRRKARLAATKRR